MPVGTLSHHDVAARFLGGSTISAIAREAGVSRTRVTHSLHKSGVRAIRHTRTRPRTRAKPQPRKPTAWWHKTEGWRMWCKHRDTTVRAARVIAERHLRRKLAPGEWVVHLDANPHNLQIANLAIMSPSDAMKHTRRTKKENQA